MLLAKSCRKHRPIIHRPNSVNGIQYERNTRRKGVGSEQRANGESNIGNCICLQLHFPCLTARRMQRDERRTIRRDREGGGGRGSRIKGEGENVTEAAKRSKKPLSLRKQFFSSENVLTLLILEQICAPAFTLNSYG